MTSATAITIRRRRHSLRIARRTLRVGGALVVLIPVLLLASVALGEYRLTVGDVAGALVGNADPGTSFVVTELRLPRALVALLAGAALGVAGAIYQEVTRNPLVSPDVVGVSGGAAAGACAVIVLTPWDGPFAVPGAALAGAAAAGALLAAMSWRDGLSGYRVVLIGIGLAALTHAAISYTLTRGRIFEVSEAYVWLVGTVNGRGWSEVLPVAAGLAVLMPAALLGARQLDAIALGDDLAAALGASVGRARIRLLLVATALTAVAVAAAGPVGFVAFIAPHLARRLGGSPSAAALMMLAGGCGAGLVLAADLLGRLLFAPTELPVGLITAVVAAPYFLVLLRRSGRIGVPG